MYGFFLDVQNKENVDKIIKSICLICLDQPISMPKEEIPRFNSTEGSESLKQMLFGGGTAQNSMNRWFDKICQVYLVYLFTVLPFSLYKG